MHITAALQSVQAGTHEMTHTTALHPGASSQIRLLPPKKNTDLSETKQVVDRVGSHTVLLVTVGVG